MHGSCIRLLTVLALTQLSPPALADSNTLSFSLIGSTSDERWQQSSSQRSQVDRLGVQFIQPFASDLHTVLELGYLNISQPAMNAIPAQSYQGQYLGVGLSQQFSLTRDSTLSLQPGYRYQQADSQGGQALQWHQWWMNVAGAIRFGALSLHAGAYWRAIDGTGDGVTARNDGTGASVGASFYDGMGGTIGVGFSTGASQEARIQFSRQYR